jgi:hypothetical protein
VAKRSGLRIWQLSKYVEHKRGLKMMKSIDKVVNWRDL